MINEKLSLERLRVQSLEPDRLGSSFSSSNLSLLTSIFLICKIELLTVSALLGCCDLISSCTLSPRTVPDSL